VRSAHTGWAPSLVLRPPVGGLPEPGPAERGPVHALRPGHEPGAPHAVRELARRVCTDRWQDAVAWRLAGALDETGWSALRRRPAGVCRRLAVAATDIERASALLGEAAGLATIDGLRWLKRSRLVQKVAQAAVDKAVPAVGECRSRVVAHCLLVTGVWLCVADGGALRACECFRALAEGRNTDRVRAELDRHLTCLRASPPGG
jgi:hypothetical protein